MADAHGSGPCGRKSLRVQLPFRPFFFFGFKHMKKYDYYRPSSFVRKRTPRRRGKGLKLFFILLFSLFILTAVCIGLSKGYKAYASSDLSNWQPKTLEVRGVEGELYKELQTLGQSKLNKPFTLKQAAALKEQLVKKYPMLREIDVSRGLFSGALKIKVQRRTPVAKFVLPGGAVRYIDSDSTVYTDDSAVFETPVPFVELEGTVPEKLSGEFVELVQNTLRLEKELSFAFLRFNLTKNEVSMHMPDGTIIEFGQARQLKDKSRRAAQIIDWCRRNEKGPQKMDFRFFENGQVFLTQID